MAYSVEQPSDIESIRDATKRYTHGLDRLDAEQMRSAFWPDATDDHGPEFSGIAWDHIYVAMESQKRWKPSLHTLANQVIQLDPDGVNASGETYCIAYLFEANRAVMYQWFGRYLDRFQKRDGEWRILERVCVHEASRMDDPVSIMPFPLDMLRQGSFDRPSSGRHNGFKFFRVVHEAFGRL
jgi:hypothetical protein